MGFGVSVAVGGSRTTCAGKLKSQSMSCRNLRRICSGLLHRLAWGVSFADLSSARFTEVRVFFTRFSERLANRVQVGDVPFVFSLNPLRVNYLPCSLVLVLSVFSEKGSDPEERDGGSGT